MTVRALPRNSLSQKSQLAAATNEPSPLEPHENTPLNFPFDVNFVTF
jgi:hypothetical protein